MQSSQRKLPPGVDLFEYIKSELLAFEAKKEAKARRKKRRHAKKKKGE